MSRLRPRRHPLRICVPLVTGAVLATCLGDALAQSPDNIRKLSAEALFDQGLRLMKASDYASACPKLAESQRLDPGIGTLLYLADCYRSLGKTASAWVTFREAAFQARKSGDTEREATATSHAEALRSELTLLSLDFAAVPSEISIELDSHPISSELIGIPFPIDPGRHALDVTAPGRKPWSMSITVSPQPGTQQIRVPALARITAPPKLERPTETQPQSKSNWTGVGWIAVGAGLGALAGAGALYSTDRDSTLGPILLGSVGALSVGAGVVILMRTNTTPGTSAQPHAALDAPLLGYQATF